MDFSKLSHILAWIMIAAITVSCSDNSGLDYMEQLIEADPAKADTLFNTFPVPEKSRHRAWYAVLKTQAEYKCYKPVISDSLILTATDYYGTPYNGPKKRRYRAAMAWYTLGCVYTVAQDDVNAIEAYLNAKNLFPDTLIRYYALMEQNLGIRFVSKEMNAEGLKYLTSSKKHSEQLSDSAMIAYASFQIGHTKMKELDYLAADSILTPLLNNSWLSPFWRKEIYLYFSRISTFYKKDYSESLYYLDLCLSDGLEKGAAYNMKGIDFYYMNNLDSAFYYLYKSLKCKNGISILYSNYSFLAESYMACGMGDSSLYYTSLMDNAVDSIYRLKNQEEVISKLMANNEKVRHSYAVRHYILVSATFILLITVMLYIIIAMKTRHKKNVDYFTGQIDNLERRNRNEAIEALFRLYESCTNEFRKNTSPDVIDSFIKNRNLSSHEAARVKHEINMCYQPFLAEMSKLCPALSRTEREFCLLNLMGVSSQNYSVLFNKSYSTASSVKSHIKSKMDKELFEKFF